jgi:hypothetical protein
MKKIARVGKSLAGFHGDYAFKWRLLTSASDVRVSIRDLDYTSPHLNSLLKFQNEQARLKAHTNGSDVWVSLSPRDPYSWFTFLIEPTSEGALPAIRLKKSFNVFAYTATGIFAHRYRQELPDLTGKLRWRNGRFTFGSSLTLSAKPVYAVRDFASSFAFRNQYLKTRAAWNHTSASNLAAVSIHFRNSEFSLAWEKPELKIAGSFGVGNFWRVAFQTFLRQLPKFSVKRKTKFGYLNGALDLSQKRIIGKVKNVTPMYNVSLIAYAERFGLGEWKFAVSFCQIADISRLYFNGPNPHVPLRI